MWVSAACAVHCASLPLILTLAGMGWLGDARLEWGIILLSFTIGSVRLFHSYFEEHHRREIVLLFLAGVAAILAAKASFVPLVWAEPVLMSVGGLTIAYAHWRNHKLGRCEHCH